MHSRSQAWESALLRMATEVSHLNQPRRGQKEVDAHRLTRAYAHCTRITSVHSRSFHLASGLLPGPQRQAVRALYAFCRTCDDVVDCSRSGDVAADLAAWRHKMLHRDPAGDDAVALAWADTRHRFRIPLTYAEQLVDGVARDLYQNRYGSFADLAAYAYGVASTVGLMSMHIIGFSGPEAMPYAIKLGVALQLTNILRDVGEDWRAGRLYLPLDELAAYQVTEADLARGEVNDRWRRFMAFQIQRNRQLYADAMPGISLLAAEGRLAVTAAADLYGAILDDIEKHDYDVFGRRAYVGPWAKVLRMPQIWRRSRRQGTLSV